MGHFDLLNYFSIAENETKARVRFSCMERMLQPCGPPPERMEDWLFFYWLRLLGCVVSSIMCVKLISMLTIILTVMYF